MLVRPGDLTSRLRTPFLYNWHTPGGAWLRSSDPSTEESIHHTTNTSVIQLKYVKGALFGPQVVPEPLGVLASGCIRAMN